MQPESILAPRQTMQLLVLLLQQVPAHPARYGWDEQTHHRKRVNTVVLDSNKKGGAHTYRIGILAIALAPAARRAAAAAAAAAIADAAEAGGATGEVGVAAGAATGGCGFIFASVGRSKVLTFVDLL
jgi:hypothetical protein